MARSAESKFWSVIPAGGSGTRLWPLSRAYRPKYLLPLLGEQSLLQQTYARLTPLSPPERIIVVAGAAHAVEIARQLPALPPENIIIEPSPKGTGPAIALAARLIAEQDPNATMGSFAADHVVKDNDAFVAAIRTAISVAQDDWLTTIGIEPTRPETGYGYIERTDTAIRVVTPAAAWVAAGFTEKPDYERAVEFVASGRFLWNASMFIWRVDSFLAELERDLPEVRERIERIVDLWNTDQAESSVPVEWGKLKSVTIDDGVMEQCDHIAVVPAEVGWSDVGDWHGLGELVREGDDVNAFRGDVLQHDSTDTLVWSTTNRLVALVGVDDLAVIDTPDALLIVNRYRAQEVRAIVDQLRDEHPELI